MNYSINFNDDSNPQEFDHVDDWTDDDFDEKEDEDMDENDDCATTGGCMPDPEEFDD
jgi:hypothetical protein